MKAPVGLLSDRTVLHSKMEGLCPDKFLFAILLPSRVWGRHAPTRPRLRSNERPSGAFEWQPGLAQARWRGFAPTRATSKCGSVAEVQSRRNATFSRIENLWSRDGSCSLHFWHFSERQFAISLLLLGTLYLSNRQKMNHDREMQIVLQMMAITAVSNVADCCVYYLDGSSGPDNGRGSRPTGPA